MITDEFANEAECNLEYYDEKCFFDDKLLPPLFSPNTFQESTYYGSNSPSPNYNRGNSNCFEPDFSAPNPFSRDMTFDLIRNMSYDIPLLPLCNNSLFMANQDEILELKTDLPDFSASHSKEKGKEEEDLCTGKTTPEIEKPKKSNCSLARKKNQRTEKRQIKKIRPEDKILQNRKILKKKKNFKHDSKNIVKNYGKAMAAFSLSEVATPYLKQILQKYRVLSNDFRKYMVDKKETIDSIGSLRDLLCPDSKRNDDQEIRLKSIFRSISEVFVRDFAVNWIFSSKSVYKSALLNYRFKMLRRVINPTGFTYLKSQ